MAIAEHDIGAVLAVERARRRGHRMTIDQEIPAERRLGLVEEMPQRVMIGVIERLDAPARLGKAQLAGIDLLAAGDDPGDRAEAHAHPRRADIDKTRQQIREHRRIEFPGLAVGVEVGPREAGRDQGRPKLGRRGKDLVDETVLRAPQGQRVETRGGEEIVGIIGAAMRRGDDERNRPPRRLPQVEDAIAGWSSRGRIIHKTKLSELPQPCHRVCRGIRQGGCPACLPPGRWPC